jgi:hypothetical protein
VAGRNAEGRWSGRIERIYWAVSRVTLAGVVGQVRTALTVLVAEINANTPGGAVTPSSEVATHAISVAVTGKRNTINLTAAQGQDTSPTNEITPEEMPRKWFRIAAAVVLGLVTIAGMVFALMQAQGWRFG